MITPVFSLTATELVPPRVALDFTTGSLDPRVSVTRALNTATRVNSSGYIEAVNANLPRFDYSTTSFGTPFGLLIEESRANLLSQSEAFNNSPWLLNNILAFGSGSVVDARLAPSNAQTADLLTESTATGAHFVYRLPGLSAGTYTYSFFARPNGRTQIGVEQETGGNAIFTLTGSGTASALGANIATITPYPDGWYRCTNTFTSTGTFGLYSIFYSAGNRSYTGNGTSGMYLWGAQLEAGAFVTSYIPTTTASVTRNADVVSITGANFSNFWRAGRGTALVRARQRTITGTRPLIQFDDTTSNNIITLRGSSANPELYIKATTDQVQIDAGTISANTGYRLAGAWATNDCSANINGGIAVQDSVATIPVVTQARLGSDGTNYLNGYLEAIEYYDERLLNASLQVVSGSAGYRSIIGPVFRDAIIS